MSEEAGGWSTIESDEVRLVAVDLKILRRILTLWL